ncbi:DNA polymerase III subunit gamma/tau [uncultured Clostridium sp.]|uniref:DNA polymerase III subunit gamma/tau n=1 Tax=uncultured Clostridium sp. TaxID=59620 RepID=UPI00260BF0B7|nr:DNA polymerase III subunit gamma/tau [uncultured Clostridium sp.]
MALSLATKYRPQKLEDVVEQEAVIKILQQQLKTNNIKNCYLFCGSSGCGKTTCARILANEINKGKGFPIEFDAASNSSVENVKSIIQSSNTKSITSEYKIFIIDECHSLSSAGWQAFLKTLEEPNAKTIFIFCTTEIQKVPQTILNRVQRFDFYNISYESIYRRLIYVCEQERLNYQDEAIKYIAKISKGRMRDALASLEKVASLDTNISFENTVNILGEIDYNIMFSLINTIIDRKQDELLNIIEKVNNKGKNFKLFINEFTTFILDINKYIILKNFDNINIPKLFEKELVYTINFEQSKSFFMFVLEQLVKLKEQTKYDNDVRSALEITLLFLCK